MRVEDLGDIEVCSRGCGALIYATADPVHEQFHDKLDSLLSAHNLEPTRFRPVD